MRSIREGAALAALLAAIAIGSSANAAVSNLVQNPSFENDDFVVGPYTPVSDWTTIGGNIGEVHNSYTYLEMGTVGSVGQAYQVVNTVPGQQYVFSFNFTGPGTPGGFAASWVNSNDIANPITVLSALSPAFNPAWDKNSPAGNGKPDGYSFIETATSTSTIIDFAAQTAGGFFRVDDVNVYALPSGLSLPGVVSGLTGGTATDPVSLDGAAIGEITGDIGGSVSDSFYKFYWKGGAFDATANLAGADPSWTFDFELLGGPGYSTVLDQGDGFQGRLKLADLPAGDYAIGVSAAAAPDPAFYINFATPVQGAIPEPATWAMMLVGFGAMGAALRSRRRMALAA